MHRDGSAEAITIYGITSTAIAGTDHHPAAYGNLARQALDCSVGGLELSPACTQKIKYTRENGGWEREHHYAQCLP